MTRRIVSSLFRNLVWASLLLALIPMGLRATPTHALTVDDQQMLVPDDYDATQYYELATNFNNHVYYQVLNDGTTSGWAFLDIKIGTLVIFWNDSLQSQSLFNGIGQNRLGYQVEDLSSNTGAAQAPSEGLVGNPDLKLSLGYATQLYKNINLGFGVQWAALDQTQSSTQTGVGGAPAEINLSQARYLSGGVYYPDLSVTSYADTQSSSSLDFAPSLGIVNSLFDLDLKANLTFNGINNTHTEDVNDLTGTMSGTVTQGLEDEGNPSWGGMGRIRIPFGLGALVLRGSYENQNLSTRHTELGTFSGSGFDATQLAGFNQVDAEEIYTDVNWSSMIGWVQGYDKFKSLLVLGLGMNGSTLEQNDVQYSPSTGGSNYNTLVATSRNDALTQDVNVPLLLGGEMELAKFARISGVLSRNIVGNSTQSTTTDSYSNSGGAVVSQNVSQVSSDLNDQWTFNVGLGLFVGTFIWDIAMNNGFLASSGGWVNPAYQSTVTWNF